MNARCNRSAAVALVACALLAAASPRCSAGPVAASDVTVKAEPDSLFAGERLNYLIIVRHDGRRSVAVQNIQAGPATSFEVAGRSESTRRLPDGSAELRVSVDLAAFGSGPQRLPGFTVAERRDARSKESRFSFRPASSVVVMAMTDSTMTQLRPPAPPFGPGYLPWLVLVPAVALVLLLAFAVFSFLRLTILKNSAGGFIDPSRFARQKLKSLDRQLTKGLAPTEGYEALSNILRQYLQYKYRFRAMEQVTQEIADELASREVRAREVVLRLLLRADFIKFADGRPDIGECRSSLKIAMAFITGTPEQLDALAQEAGEAQEAPGGEPAAKTTE
ncbi:MAG: hypothetical protein HGB04_06230 [Chlorobiaceae bacterium]|nr:hypothetical protein [Chlorobiaceae bacterium]